jgi:S1-C subfamily serine protease
MRIELRVTSGSRAGQRELFEKAVVSIGRHGANDFRFHPELDPDVSSRHAEIRVLGETATIRDVGSTNGTFVNGERIEAPRRLRDGDTICFGAEGPVAEFHMVAPAPPPAQTRLSSPPPSSEPRRDTTVRIAEAVEQQTGKLRKMVLALGVLVLVGLGSAWFALGRNAARAQAQVAALLSRNDSLSSALEKTVRAMGGKVAGIDSALAASKAENARLRSRIRSAMQSGTGDVRLLTAQLDRAQSQQQSLITAVGVDYEAIAAKNGPAIVFIAIQYANGKSVSGSGFNVSPSGLVVTNRHVVLDDQGKPATRVMVIFDGMRGQWRPAHVVKVSPSDELAFIKVDAGGPYPVVAGVAKGNGLRVGAPVAILGFPLGTSTIGMGGDINKILPVSTLGVGTVSKVVDDTLQFDAYAAEGSSGSPVFDARGSIVYAVPSAKLAAQMPGEGAATVR